MCAPRCWGRAQTIAAARRWHTEHGASPRANQWPAPGCPSASTVNRLFGGFDVMLGEAGLPFPPRRQRRWTAERIAESIRACERAHGRTPRASDLAAATPDTPSCRAHVGSEHD